MPLAGIVTLIAVGLVVAALAVYLITVAVLLRSVSFNLGTIIAGVWAIAYQTEPLRQQFDRINRSLASSRQAMDNYLAEHASASPQSSRPEQPPNRTGASGRQSTARRAPGRKAAAHKTTGRR